MIAPLAKLMDWSAMQLVALMTPAKAPDPRVEEAIQYLKSPDFIPADSQPARVEFQDSLHFRFPTPCPCEFAENNVVHGRLYRCQQQWRERPTIILLPGWNDSATYNLRFPRIARLCNRAGLNAATIVPPYHFRRRPRQRAEFEGVDFLFWAQRTTQAIAEIRALIGWLLKQGCPAAALWGYSMGADDAALTACYDARVAAVVMACPAARLRPWLEQHAVHPRFRRRLPGARAMCEQMNLTPLNLTLLRPAIPAENILLIEGTHDIICLKPDIEDLWRTWGQPDIWRLPYGHVNICCGFAPGLSERIQGWLAPRLNKPALAADVG